MTTLMEVRPPADDTTRQRPIDRPPRDRRWLALVALGGLVVAGAVVVAGGAPDLNRRGLPVLGDALRAALTPELSPDFLRLTLDAVITTAAFAFVGTALAVSGGALVGVLISRRLWQPAHQRGPRASGAPRLLVRAALGLPRAAHEVVIALLLVRVLGLDPIVGILAIAIPGGAFTAKVVADLIDDSDPSAFQALRAAGAPRLSALGYSLAPVVRGPFAAYSFYRLECSLRSAAVLGIVGAGGLGTELLLSLQSLHFEEVWTLTGALVLLAMGIDQWSNRARAAARSSRQDERPNPQRWSAAAFVVATVAGWWWLAPDAGRLVSDRSARLGRAFLRNSLPPDIGGIGARELAAAAAVTVAAAVLASVLSVLVALFAAPLASRNALQRLLSRRGQVVVAVLSPIARLGLTVARAVPPPLMALFAVFVIRPGVWPAALALGIGNAGVLARLVADELDDLDLRPALGMAAAGAPVVSTFAYGVAPRYARRLASLGAYRFEMVLRDTVIVGIVAAGGLGQLLDEALSSFALSTAMGIVITIGVLTLATDALSSRLRAALR